MQMQVEVDTAVGMEDTMMAVMSVNLGVAAGSREELISFIG